MGIDQALDQAASISCPVLFNFGGTDPFIPPDAVERIRSAFAGRPDIQIQEYAGGHAFDNHFAAGMHSPDAAAQAWERTSAFLAANL